MIRIVQMAEHTGNEGDFALWDTVIDTFIRSLSTGEVIWNREIFEKMTDCTFKNRVLSLLGDK